MNREEAQELLHTHMQNVNLRRHCYAVEAVMRALARRFKEDEDAWGIAGLLHDADYEELKGTDEVHTEHAKRTVSWLEKTDAGADIKDAIFSHAWGYVEGAPQPKTKMQWSLYCCDELTGLIVAVALVKPDKKLSSVTVESDNEKVEPEKLCRGG